MKTQSLDELFNEIEDEKRAEHQRRVESGEDAAEREAFRVRSEAEQERLVRNGCIESESDRADDEEDEEDEE